ncbi:MAG: hypothetical protein HWQ41_16500 [Nostoc sp. NOS(2021)]|uniref:ApeA N-terminal domain 1-containing protein n=1 Tax=Nostoc sp. NOS(2021) TaxID=2815407 RepID=UPI0025F0FC66|nr:HEPN domain-containing protein [Nostoc sp. NOS(2021)]MBN3896803.1 hypothetical protein [Nostoc sp. NOS(2021)]
MVTAKLTFPEFEVQGRWFLPENPDYGVVGILKFSPYELPELKLVGSLIERMEETVEEQLKKAFSKENIPIILGVLSNGETIGEKVTLYKNVVYGEGISTGLVQTKCIPAYILRGFHFYREEDIRLENIYFHFVNLEKWLRIQNINVTMTSDFSKTRIEELRVQYNPLPRKSLCDVGDFNLGIKDRPINPTGLYFASIFSQHIGEVNILEDKLFELNSPEPNDLDSYIKGIFKVQDFLVFATGQSTNLTEVGTLFKTKVKKPKIEGDIESLIKKMPHSDENVIFQNEYFSISNQSDVKVIEDETEEIVPIKIYFRISISDSKENFDEDKVLFYFADVEDILDIVFLKWYSDSKKIEPVINLYLGLFYLPKRYLTERFLTLAQAIEAFHRILFGGRYIDKQEYENGIYQSLLQVIESDSNLYNLSSEFKDSLKLRLSYLYEFSLRKRLKELIRLNQSCFPTGFITKKELRDNFIGSVVLIRNKLTHLDENTDIQSIIEYRQLYRLSNHLEALLRCCIMRFLGVNEEVIKRRVEQILMRQ